MMWEAFIYLDAETEWWSNQLDHILVRRVSKSSYSCLLNWTESNYLFLGEIKLFWRGITFLRNHQFRYFQEVEVVDILICIVCVWTALFRINLVLPYSIKWISNATPRSSWRCVGVLIITKITCTWGGKLNTPVQDYNV